MILDIHTHRAAPYPEGIVSLLSCNPDLIPGQLYSIGIHPWSTGSEAAGSEDSTGYNTPPTLEQLRKLASDPSVVAIGECGVDILKGGPMFRQLQLFKAQVEISESVRKPLIIHSVKASDVMLGLKRDLNPSQLWIIHGFRGKPQLASQLLNAGFYLSFGEKFNPETISMMPRDKILAETDESLLDIRQIISNLSEAAGADLTPGIERNTRFILNL